MGKTRTLPKLPPVEQLRGRPLGRVLIKIGILTREQVHECLKIQQEHGGSVQLGQILIDQGLIDENQLRLALASQRGMEYVNLDEIEVPSGVIEKVPAQTAKAYRVVPIEYSEAEKRLTVALDNPGNFRATDDLSTLMGFKVTAKVTDAEALDKALAKYYSKDDENISQLIGEIQGDSFLAEFEGRNES